MINKELIHWWELPPECPVKVRDDYIKDVVKSTRNLYIKKRTLENIKSGIKCPRVKTLLKLVRIFKLNIADVERNISHIKTHNKLIKINFPVKESPNHIQILSHAIFDGSKEINSCLRYKVRFDTYTKECFKELLINTFGNDCFGHTDNCYFLYKSFAELLSNHYKITNFKSKEAYFSAKVLKLSKNERFRRAILTAAFVDEGYCKHNITSKNHEKLRLTLVSSIKNKKLANQLSYLAKLEGFSISMYRARNNTEFTIAILTESKNDFYKQIISKLPNGHRKRLEAESALAKAF